MYPAEEGRLSSGRLGGFFQNGRDVGNIVVSESLVQFSGFSEFGGENTQISPEFGANRANT